MKILLITFTMIVGVMTMIGGASAAVLTCPWDPNAGDEIISQDVKDNNAAIEAVVNALDADNYADSSVTFADIGAGAVNSTHVTSIGPNTIDSGAINSDSMFSRGVLNGLAANIASNVDTPSGFARSMNGIYYGDGTDSRHISWNNMGDLSTGQYGETIPFLPTYVKIWPIVGLTVTVEAFDVLGGSSTDTNYANIVTDMAGSIQLDKDPLNMFGGIDSAGDSIPYFGTFTGGDSTVNWFNVNDEGGATLNTAGQIYIWRAEGI